MRRPNVTGGPRLRYADARPSGRTDLAAGPGPSHAARSWIITLASLPLRAGASGPDVADLQRRLRAAGFGCDADEPGDFGPATRAAVESFQAAAGLDGHGECDAATWSALIESEYLLGSRLLCLRSPMMRGDDVADLQLRLGAMGFDAGRVDGIFGPLTQHAVGDFQRNAGLVSDEVCGPDTVQALMRLEGRAGSATVTAVRERERLRRALRSLDELRVTLGTPSLLTTSESQPVVAGLAARLQQAGAAVLLVEGDWSDQALAANGFGADLYLGVVLTDEPLVEARYFSVPGYESEGGRHLAELVVRELPATPGWGIGVVRGMRLPILRETRAPAVLLKLGAGSTVDVNHGLVIASLQRAVAAWADEPCST